MGDEVPAFDAGTFITHAFHRSERFKLADIDLKPLKFHLS
jgi:hypothetical protein